MEDLTKRIRELEWQVTQLTHDLIHDPLTGLKTRAYFEEQVGSYLRIIADAKEFTASQRKERFGFSTLSIVFFDIDHFKEVNDTYGHEVGDTVLQEVSHALKMSLRTGDTIARWGGEEIVASLLGAHESEAGAKADEVRRKIAELRFPDAPTLRVTISAGITEYNGEELRELVRKSDHALYTAKKAGRNRVVKFSELKS